MKKLIKEKIRKLEKIRKKKKIKKRKNRTT